MLFNSIDFLFFLPLFFAVYWMLRRWCRMQNLWIVAGSYFFYGCWDWRFLVLIFITSVVGWLSGILMEGESRRKLWVGLSVGINIGILGVFKYYDFFVSSFSTLFGLQSDGVMLRLVLPVGISFYTFQTLSYSIDVYRRRIVPTRDLIAFLAYVSFFPQLVAGPIERATSLLPQFLSPRRFDYSKAVDGMRQMLFGYFMKVAVADRCGVYVDAVWDSYGSATQWQLVLAAVLFSIQIYGDFAGYSNIAIGCAKLFNISLRTNFRTPYFSRDIAEFWRRWHISLTTWFRDYIYIPMGGSRCSRAKVVRNTFVIFLVSGLWHGANWTFVLWGIYHALLFLPLILSGRNRRHVDVVAQWRSLPSMKEIVQMLSTFALCTLGWILFRAQSVKDAAGYVAGMVHRGEGVDNLPVPWMTIGFVVLMIVIEWLNRKAEHGLDLGKVGSRFLRLIIYYILLIIILIFSVKSESFIYFQF